MKKFFVGVIFGLVVFGSWYAGWYMRGKALNSEVLTASATPKPTPLVKYQIERMIENQAESGEIEIGLNTKTERGFETYLFNFWHKPDFDGDLKKSSGVVNIPEDDGLYPIILMARGYVDEEIYEPGMGTKNASEYFSQNGFITIAPDFLGYGSSDSVSPNIFESRFQTYSTFASLIETVYLKDRDKLSFEIYDKWDKQNVFIWAHSNGGQISLTSLVATGRAIPTTLWAPVTKPFPYSILYFTDESVDGGKFIRRELSKFEELYDVSDYNFDNYMDRLSSKLQLHQGTADDAVPLEWTNEFSRMLSANDISYNYYVYPGADHNLRPDWNTVVERDLDFFRENIIIPQ